MFVDWNKLSKEQLSQISKTASIKQGSFRSNDNLNCFRKDCNNKNCQDNIDYLYSVIVDSLKESCQTYTKIKLKCNEYKVIPGWNRRVKELHFDKREKYKIWLQHDRPRLGIIFDYMATSRKLFNNELKKCKNNVNNEISKSIQEKFQNKSMKEFWREISNKKH